MTLRRTAIARKSELRRSTPMPRAKRERAARVKTVTRRVRDTGPTTAQRALVAERAGYCCEICGTGLHDGHTWTAVHSFHHRQARGMGGSSDKAANSPSNLLLLCGSGVTGCHGFVEAHRPSAELAGWLVRHGLDPAQVPVNLYVNPMRPVLLTPGGDYREETP